MNSSDSNHPLVVLLSPTVPAKRKRSNTAILSRPYNHRPHPHTTSPPPETASSSQDAIHCICGFTHDDGFSIACDDCGRWSHTICFGIQENGVPDEWKCWLCVPRPVDRDRAVRVQRARKKEIDAGLTGRLTGGLASGNASAANGTVASGGANGKRRRERRASVNMYSGIGSGHPPTSRVGEEEHVEIEEEWKSTYVPIAADIVPHPSTRNRLRQHGRGWRGVSALSLSPKPPTKTQVMPVPRDADDLTAAVRPPSYALHTTAPISQTQLITPLRSTIVPSAVYLSDPLNAYAHLGMPKPHVHMIPPPLSLALDSRTAGNEARFVRSGCRPNAVLRPVLCRAQAPSSPSPFANCHSNIIQPSSADTSTFLNQQSRTQRQRQKQDDIDTTLSFAIFALRDLKAREEIVLGWEWDDGAVVHELPALIEAGVNPGEGPSRMTPHHRARLRLQMQDIVHSLSSTFTTCACGARTKDCAVELMKAFVDNDKHVDFDDSLHDSSGHVHHHLPFHPDPQSYLHSHRPTLSPSPSPPPPPSKSVSASPPNRHPKSLAALHEITRLHPLDLGPLIGAKRGMRTRVVGGADGGGMCGVELVEDESADVDVDMYEVESGEDVGERLGMGADIGRQRPAKGRCATADSGLGLALRSTPQRRKTSLPELRLQEATPSKQDRKGKGRAVDDGEENMEHTERTRPMLSVRIDDSPSAVNGHSRLSPSLTSADCVDGVGSRETQGEIREEQMPPKMRKRWIKRESEALKEVVDREGGFDGPRGEVLFLPTLEPDELSQRHSMTWGRDSQNGVPVDTSGREEERMDVDRPPSRLDPLQMPPPPIPAFLDPTTIISPHANSKPLHPASRSGTRSISPSLPFSNMSILSPIQQRSSLPRSPPPSIPAKLPLTLGDGGRKDGQEREIGGLEERAEGGERVGGSPGELARDGDAGAMEVDKESEAAPESHDESSENADVLERPLTGTGPARVRFASPLPASPSEETRAEERHLSPPHPHPDAHAPPDETQVAAHAYDADAPTATVDTQRHPSPSISDASTSDAHPAHKGNANQHLEPPKVRRSMADYIQRKRQQREEQERAAQTATSPVTPVTPLPAEWLVGSPQTEVGALPGALAGGLADERAPGATEAADNVRDNAGVNEDMRNAQGGVDGEVADVRKGDLQARAGDKEEVTFPASELRLLVNAARPDPDLVVSDSAPPALELVAGSRPVIPKEEDEPLETEPSPEVTMLQVKNERRTASALMPPSALDVRPDHTDESPPTQPAVHFKSNKHSPTPQRTVSPRPSPKSLSPTRQGEEDGEIPSTAPALAPPYRNRASFHNPRPHTPPTQPRSFHSESPLSASPPLQYRRPPAHPTPYRAQHPAHAAPSRPVPSGPRALREHTSFNHRGGSSYIPRAPLADRDRMVERHDWERGRAWPAPRGRGRGGGSGSSWAR